MSTPHPTALAGAVKPAHAGSFLITRTPQTVERVDAYRRSKVAEGSCRLAL